MSSSSSGGGGRGSGGRGDSARAHLVRLDVRLVRDCHPLDGDSEGQRAQVASSPRSEREGATLDLCGADDGGSGKVWSTPLRSPPL
jgi:hypothetical protein